MLGGRDEGRQASNWQLISVLLLRALTALWTVSANVMLTWQGLTLVTFQDPGSINTLAIHLK